MPSKPSATTHTIKYENNPFKLALDGLNLVIKRAGAVATLLIVLSVLSVFSGMFRQPASPKDDMDFKQFQDTVSHVTPEQWIVGGIVVTILLVAFIFITSMISGIGAYTAARVARGHDVRLSEAFHAVLDRFFSYIWLQILQGVKLFLWTLLLIVPGFIMSIRYSLANVAFFDKGLKGNDAIKASLTLTKGAWLTTYASQSLFNFITFGVISELVNTGSRSLLYRQLSQFKKGQAKPEAHLLSWIALLAPFIFVILLLLLIILFVGFVAIIGSSHFSN